MNIHTHTVLNNICVKAMSLEKKKLRESDKSIRFVYNEYEIWIICARQMNEWMK